jgi:hypothetical protein
MSKVVTKIGNVEVTPGIAAFLDNMLEPDLNKLAVNGYLDDLRDVQDFLTRTLLDMEISDPMVIKSCLSTVMAVSDQLGLLLQEQEEGGSQ